MLEWMTTDTNQNPLDTTLFLELDKIATEGLQGERRAFPSDLERFTEEARPGIYLMDVPENQAAFSAVQEIRRRFDKEDAQRVSTRFLMRWFAFRKALAAGRLAEFTIEDDGQKLLHESAWSVSAECPITDSLSFDDTFESRIRADIARLEAEDHEIDG